MATAGQRDVEAWSRQVRGAPGPWWPLRGQDEAKEMCTHNTHMQTCTTVKAASLKMLVGSVQSMAGQPTCPASCPPEAQP